MPFSYFCFLLQYKARLALYCKRKQKYQNGNIHRKLKVPTSEREGKLSNPRGPAARPRCIIFFSKIYEIPRKNAARESCSYFAPLISTVISSRVPSIQVRFGTAVPPHGKFSGVILCYSQRSHSPGSEAAADSRDPPAYTGTTSRACHREHRTTSIRVELVRGRID